MNTFLKALVFEQLLNNLTVLFSLKLSDNQTQLTDGNRYCRIINGYSESSQEIAVCFGLVGKSDLMELSFIADSVFAVTFVASSSGFYSGKGNGLITDRTMTPPIRNNMVLYLFQSVAENLLRERLHIAEHSAFFREYNIRMQNHSPGITVCAIQLMEVSETALSFRMHVLFLIRQTCALRSSAVRHIIRMPNNLKSELLMCYHAKTRGSKLDVPESVHNRYWMMRHPSRLLATGRATLCVQKDSLKLKITKDQI